MEVLLSNRMNRRVVEELESTCAAYAMKTLKPGEEYKLSIGTDYKIYPEADPCECFICEGGTCKPRPDPKTNIYYMHDRPEGYLKIEHCHGDNYYSTKMFEIFLIEETEQYQKMRDDLVKIRIDQKRRARFGEILSSNGEEVSVSFVVGDDVDQYVRNKGSNPFFPPKVQNKFWENTLFNRTVPENLEDVDKMTDAEIEKNERRAERKVLFKKDGKKYWLDWKQLRKEIHENWNKVSPCELFPYNPIQAFELLEKEEEVKAQEALKAQEKKAKEDSKKSEEPPKSPVSSKQENIKSTQNPPQTNLKLEVKPMSAKN